MAFAGDDCYDTPIEAQSIQILIMNVEILSNNICYMRKHSSETCDMLIKLLKAIKFTIKLLKAIKFTCFFQHSEL